ncbi:hypothetical protein MKY37_07620 [Psychrobacillus sp. FSL K6-2836]|uniref:hypothetical protein n=1 Tax=Psychrobacillus sp. FSL K6-2836 TaxID=2921548 RepID=UPI0030F94A85
MNKNKMALAALGVGAAFLMRNKGSRDKLAKQFDSFTNTPIRGTKADKTATSSTKGKNILGGLFN